MGEASAPAGLADLGFVDRGRAPRGPERLSGCAYDAAGRLWVPRHAVPRVPKARRASLLRGFGFQVEEARSGAAACKRCGERIAKAALRLGYPTKDPRGEYGAIPSWFHIRCAAQLSDPALSGAARKGDGEMKDRVLGYDALRPSVREQLCQDLLCPAEGGETAGQDGEMQLPALLPVRKLQPHPQPLSLQVKLLPFQAEGLGWMLAREADRETRGGILADEMGMGKTLQTISLLLSSDMPGATLVVCPAAAMLQWRNEIIRFTEPGALDVRLYYGFDRKGLSVDGCSKTVVLTTYQTLEHDYRVEVNKCKVPCEWCGRLFLPEKLRYHQKYFCGPDAERTEKQQMQERKGEAVRKMLKIGGHETTISLSPLTAMRKVSVQARQRAKLQEPSRAVPFPVSVLPAEAKAAIAKGRGRGRKAQGSASGRKRPLEPGAAPQGPEEPRKRWQPDALARGAEAVGPTAVTPSKLGGWGALLRSAPLGRRVIELDAVSDGDSDLELRGEISTGEALVFGGSSGGSSSSSAPVRRPSAPEVPGADSLPPRPESEDGDDGDDTGRVDLSRSPLFRTLWSRIVLDEAHRIKGRTNGTAQAAFALRASCARWCLSGTPLQNRVGEFWSIIRFLRFYPYAHYFCSKRGCDCVSLHYRFDPDTSLCRHCGHAKMQHRSHFACNVANPIKKFGFLGAGRTAMEKLRGEVLDRILLRRTKLERAADVNLPPLEIKLRRDKLSAEEQDFYTSMYTQSRTMFDTYVDRGTVLHNYAHVFDLIMRLRQAVDHPYLIIHGSLASAEAIPSASRGGSDICALCQDDIDEPGARVAASCGHAFHRDCITEYLEQAPKLPSGGIGCPTCFSPLTLSFDDEGDEQDGAVAARPSRSSKEAPADDVPVQAAASMRGSIMQRIKTSEFKTSTKIEALMQELQRMQEKDPCSKALVFSQFTRFLELVEWRIKREGVSCAKLLGTMPIASRNNIIISFQTDPSLKVLLISLKAGGEGLNLQAADHIFIMDPWWNPASELQAIQRAHRIGQTRLVQATRFIATGTIEEKIVELQQKKQSVFDCTVGGSNQALQRLTSQDIQFLFSTG